MIKKPRFNWMPLTGDTGFPVGGIIIFWKLRDRSIFYGYYDNEGSERPFTPVSSQNMCRYTPGRHD